MLKYWLISKIHLMKSYKQLMKRLVLTVLMTTALLTAAAYEMHYEVSFEPETHYINVELNYTTDTIGTPVVLKMPVWAPGYYVIVDYPKYLTDFSVSDETGKLLKWEKQGKNGWAFTPVCSKTQVRWRIYANERSVAESRVENTIGFLTPNGVFMHRDGDIAHDCHIHHYARHVDTHLNWACERRKHAGMLLFQELRRTLRQPIPLRKSFLRRVYA